MAVNTPLVLVSLIVKIKNVLPVLTVSLNITKKNIGKTTLSLYEKINLHKRAKSGYMYVIKNVKAVCVSASWSVQIIEICPGTEYKNRMVCPVNRETRLGKEDCWIEILRTSYVYSLNKRKRRPDPNLPAACSIPK